MHHCMFFGGLISFQNPFHCCPAQPGGKLPPHTFTTDCVELSNSELNPRKLCDSMNNNFALKLFLLSNEKSNEQESDVFWATENQGFQGNK